MNILLILFPFLLIALLSAGFGIHATGGPWLAASFGIALVALSFALHTLLWGDQRKAGLLVAILVLLLASSAVLFLGDYLAWFSG